MGTSSSRALVHILWRIIDKPFIPLFNTQREYCENKHTSEPVLYPLHEPPHDAIIRTEDRVVENRY